MASCIASITDVHHTSSLLIEVGSWEL
jgi:hypothetical protein